MASQLNGGINTAPNRAPAAKVLAGALSNERVAQSLISALGAYSNAAAIIATATSATTDFGALMVGDLVLHVPATAGNSSFGSVATAGTLPNDGGVAVIGDLYLVLRAVNLDSNNPIPYSTLNGNKTGNGGQEF